MYHCTYRNIGDRQSVSGFDVGIRAGVDHVAVFEPDRSDNVALIAVLILQQRDIGRPVGVVLNTDDGRRRGVQAFEINDSVLLLVAAAPVANRDFAVAVASGVLLFYNGKRLFGGVLGYLLEGRNVMFLLAGVVGLYFVGIMLHPPLSVHAFAKNSMVFCPGLSVTIAFFQAAV